MLGLSDEVGRDEHRVGRVIRDDRDLGRAGLGVDSDPAAQQPLGGCDVHVARPAHHVGGGAAGRSVREHRDRLGAADRVHLVHAE